MLLGLCPQATITIDYSISGSSEEQTEGKAPETAYFKGVKRTFCDPILIYDNSEYFFYNFSMQEARSDVMRLRMSSVPPTFETVFMTLCTEACMVK